MLKRFLQSGLTGFYCSVLQEGAVTAGDPIELLFCDVHQVRVADVTRLYRQDKQNVELLRRVVKVGALTESWRDEFCSGSRYLVVLLWLMMRTERFAFKETILTRRRRMTRR